MDYEYEDSCTEELDEQDTGHAKKIPLKIINEFSYSICKLRIKTDYNNSFGTGFFMNIDKNGKKLKCLITNFHVVGKSLIDSKAEIIAQIHNGKNITIKLDSEVRYIEIYEKPDITIICIDDLIINDMKFISYNTNSLSNFENYVGKYVFILQHPLGQALNFACGRIIDINNERSEFEHTVDTDKGSSGSPVILIPDNPNNFSDYYIIGVHKRRKRNDHNNIGIFLKIIEKKSTNINELNAYNNTDTISELYNNLSLKKLVSHIITIQKTKDEIIAKKLICPFKCQDKINELKHWITTWHGTRLNALESLLKNGLLLPGSDFGSQIRPKLWSNISDWCRGIFVSPSIFYASDVCYSQRILSNNKRWCVLIEAKIRPNSYTCHKSTLIRYKRKKGEPSELEFRLENKNDIIVQSVTFVLSSFIEDSQDYIDGEIMK